MLTLLLSFSATTIQAQTPGVWIFGRNAGLNFNSGQAVPVSYDIDNCYSPSSSQCDADGNLLFYCDGRSIKDPAGQVMPGSENPVWPSPMHPIRKIVSTIIPVPGSNDQYFVFMLTPSSGIPPYGTYYQGALTYSVVDMSLNNGQGAVDPTQSNVLLDTELDMDMITAPAKDCGYWLITYNKSTPGGKFQAYKITEQGIAAPVYSTVNIPGFPFPLNNMEMVYAPKHHKILMRLASSLLAAADFDDGSGSLSNSSSLLLLTEFRSQGGGSTTPSFCLSPNEQLLYLLGYPYAGTGPNGPEIKLQQYALDLTAPTPVLNQPQTIFASNDVLYQIPATTLPYHSQECDIRTGPDNKIYMVYNTGMSFLGKINQPDNPGLACDLLTQGVQLLPNTFGSYYLPATENKRVELNITYRQHDTLLCFTEPLTLRPDPGTGNFHSFVWDDGSTAQTRSVYKAGTYWVRSAGSCNDGEQTDSFTVRIKPASECNCNMFIPNAFSPNNDNTNDIFKPVLPLSCMNGGYHLTIYNRWGESVFFNHDITKGWDGTINGRPADMGSYHYMIRYEDIKHTQQSFKGTLTLLR